MPSTLQKSLGALTRSLVDSVMNAIRDAPLEEVLGERFATYELARVSRSPDEITDPERLLALTDAEPPRSSPRRPPPTEPEPAQHVPIRLRAHETVARVSAGGVVIRRSR